MKRWALISGDLVANVVEQEDQPQIGGVWMEVTGQYVGPGYTYENNTFTPPPKPPLVVSKAVLLDSFTDSEFVQILVASKTDPEVELWKIRFDNSATINLDDPRTISGFDMLVAKNLLTPQRKTEILTAPTQPNELP